ncbi:MAG: hypothetical protein K2X98_05105, partial [Alphaproteobacteria bacterium]|nr:hypothetical protein [Alphaproteobacteria bacterium]
KIVDVAYKETEKLLRDKIKDLHALAGALLEFETLTGDEIKKLLMEGIEPTQKRTKTPPKTAVPTTESLSDTESGEDKAPKKTVKKPAKPLTKPSPETPEV